MVEVGAKATGRHQLPRHGFVEAVEEGLVVGWGLRRGAGLLRCQTGQSLRRHSTLITFGFFHTGVGV